MPQELCLAESIVSNAVVPVLRILRTTDVLVLCARVFPLDIAMTLDAAEQTKNTDYTRLNPLPIPLRLLEHIPNSPIEKCRRFAQILTQGSSTTLASHNRRRPECRAGKAHPACLS